MLPLPTALRHDLHRHPELSGAETETARRLADFIRPYAPTRMVTGLGGTGLAVVFSFAETGPTLLFRAELDALPIQEVNQVTHRSVNPGVAHLCGHDGHAALLAGLAPWLSQCRFDAGRVVLLFQPAEETGKGAMAVLDDPLFADLRPDYVFALHNVPGYPLHEVVRVAGQFSPTVQSMAIRLFGKESHASEPENGINPAMAVAELVTALQQQVVANPARPDFALVTPVHLLVGQPDYGISAGYGEAHFTLRTWTADHMAVLVASLTTYLNTICAAHGLCTEVDWFDYFPATHNDPFCNDLVKQAATAAGLNQQERPMPFKFGEDFGWFTHHFRGTMFGLGAGLNTPALHNPDYDFPDDLLLSGGAVFRGIIQELLGDKAHQTVDYQPSTDQQRT